MSSDNIAVQTRTFTAGGTITQWDRVKLSAGTVVQAGSTDVSIGTALKAASSGESVTVRLANTVGTITCRAVSAIAVGDDVYGAAAGEVSNNASDDYIGIALEAATSEDDEIEVLAAGGQSPGAIRYIEQDIVIGDFTDNADATGYVDTDDTLPAGALVLGWKATVTTGFTGDTSASAQLGIAGNLNAFTTTAASVLAAATVGAAAPGSGDSPVLASAAAARLTVTGASDFGGISAGALTLKIAYVPL